MTKTRLEAFSDGVLAIIITIMVLELKVPETPGLLGLRPLLPIFASYAFSFTFIGIYWNNHHHLLQASQRVTAAVLWANLHLLFWLSLVPFGTAWMGRNSFDSASVALYGLNMLFCGMAYFFLTRALVAAHGQASAIARALGRDAKGKASLFIYAMAIPLAFWSSSLSMALYALVAAIWLVPDRRMEKAARSRE